MGFAGLGARICQLVSDAIVSWESALYMLGVCCCVCWVSGSVLVPDRDIGPNAKSKAVE